MGWLIEVAHRFNIDQHRFTTLHFGHSGKSSVPTIHWRFGD
jgi:hypothetical protein